MLNYLGGVGLEDAGEAVAAVLVEEDRGDEEQDGEARRHRGVLDGEHTQRDHLHQDQREHDGVVHDGPQLPSHLVLRVVHVQNLHSKIQFKLNGKTSELGPTERSKTMPSPDSDTPSSLGRSRRARRAG